MKTTNTIIECCECHTFASEHEFLNDKGDKLECPLCQSTKLKDKKFSELMDKVNKHQLQTAIREARGEKWDNEFDATLEYDNNGNDFYYEWTNLNCEDYNSLESLFDDVFGVDISNSPVKVRIKTKKDHSVFITLTAGGEDE